MDFSLSRAPADQLSVGTRLDAITTKVDEFHKLEQRRYTEYQQRADQMGSRLAQLEQQACDLRRTLDDERRRARIDALTGIANRAAFDERFGQELARCSRGGGKVCVLLWDLDHFKAINDRFGHRVGDGVLREVARCLVHALRIEDFVARIGGEEFAMILPGLTRSQAAQFCERLRSAFERHDWRRLHPRLEVTLSIGIAQWDGESGADQLLHAADARLYDAKRAGRNRVA